MELHLVINFQRLVFEIKQNTSSELIGFGIKKYLQDKIKIVFLLVERENEYWQKIIDRLVSFYRW